MLQVGGGALKAEKKKKKRDAFAKIFTEPLFKRLRNSFGFIKGVSKHKGIIENCRHATTSMI